MIVDWIKKRTDKQQLVILAFLVGLFSGTAAVVLKTLVKLISGLLTDNNVIGKYGFLYLLLPGIGMFIALLLVRFVIKDNLSHGITKILYAISRNKSKLTGKTIWAPLITSAITIGFGGSVGAEAPIVHSGASIGSVLAQKFNLSYHKITLLLVCGAAGAIAGIFKAPLAGIIFSIEILLFDFTLSSIIPLLVSTVTAICVTYFTIGRELEFATSVVSFNLSNIPFYLLLGVCCGFMSLYFIRTSLWLEGKIGAINNIYKKLLYCALLLGVLIFIFPPLYGEGYSSLGKMLNYEVETTFSDTLFSFIGKYNTAAWFIPLFWFFVMMTKVFSMSLTNAGGGVGGTFGPTLFVGGTCGFVLSRIINLSDIIALPEANFALAGMGGLMAGVMHAPMTGIFLIAEITGGYALIIPLIITVTASYIVTNTFEKNSIYTKRLALSGDLLTHDKDQTVLTLLSVEKVIEKNFETVYPTDSLRYLIEVVAKTKRNIFPVVDNNNVFEGLLYLDDIRSIMFDSHKYDNTFVKDVMHNNITTIRSDEKMDVVVNKFQSSGAWNLPVVDKGDHYVGMISKSKLFSEYREQLIEVSGE